VQQLYAVERAAKESGATPEERLAQRRLQSIAPYEEIFSLLDQWAAHVAPKTPLGQAITYARNRRIELGRFFEDGRLALDNGDVERLIRVIAVHVSLCALSSSTWNHESAIVTENATRATSTLPTAA
jgi:hypothetical protein